MAAFPADESSIASPHPDAGPIWIAHDESVQSSRDGRLARTRLAVPAPLGIGSIELSDGSLVQGFLCEAAATTGAKDISHHGGWRSYLASIAASA